MTNLFNLADAIRQRKSISPHLISIDGFMGAGKSTIATQLADELTCALISTDAFVDPDADGPHYLDRLRLQEMKEEVSFRMRTCEFIIVEGICVISVLSEVGVRSDTRIYVKRISELGLWHDGLHLEDYLGERSIKENEEGLHRSEFDYHAHTRPHESADFVFERLDSETS